MLITLGDKLCSYSPVKNWAARFRTGHLNTADENSGRPTQVPFPENMDDAIRSTVLKDKKISMRKIAETLAIS
jgi:hypothetical protein